MSVPGQLAVSERAQRQAPLRRLGRPPMWLVKVLVFVASLLPLAYLLATLLGGHLGPNPIEAITHFTGEYALRFLLLSLALTPLRWLLRDVWPIRLRRMLGLFAFFYACLHVLTYAVLDQQLSVAYLLEDLLERPYIMAGTLAFAVLLPLAFTSTKGWARRLGKRWQGLHRWVYVGAAAAVVHFVWLAKGDRVEPFVYLAILAVLLIYRLKRIVAA